MAERKGQKPPVKVKTLQVVFTALDKNRDEAHAALWLAPCACCLDRIDEKKRWEKKSKGKQVTFGGKEGRLTRSF